MEVSNVRTESVPAPTASQATPDGVTIISDKEASVVDANGRMIKVKKIGAVQRMNLFRLAGAEASTNQSFMNYANVAASVTAIAGEPILFPTTDLQLQSIISRLDDDGVEAVARALIALIPAEKDVAAATQNLS